jgi:hypothetical protein
MKVYVWNRIEAATNSYHSEGGVVVFAWCEERARELAASNGAHIGDFELPDEVRDVAQGGEAVYIMPDAGCC